MPTDVLEPPSTPINPAAVAPPTRDSHVARSNFMQGLNTAKAAPESGHAVAPAPTPPAAQPPPAAPPAPKVDPPAPPAPPAATPPAEPASEAASDTLRKLAAGELTELPKKPNPGQAPPADDEPRVWKEMRAQRLQFKKEAEELREQLAKREPVAPPDYEQTKKELAETKLRLEQQDLSQSDQYRTEVIQPLNGYYAMIKQVTDTAQIPFPAVIAALENKDVGKGDAEIISLLQGAKVELNALQWGRVSSALDNIRDLRTYGESLLSDAPKINEARKAEATQKAQAQEQQMKIEHQRASDLTLEAFSKEIPLLHNNPEALAEVQQALNADWKSMKAVPRAMALASVPLLIRMNDEVRNLKAASAAKDKEIASAKEQLARLGGAGPPANGAPANTNGTSAPDTRGLGARLGDALKQR